MKQIRVLLLIIIAFFTLSACDTLEKKAKRTAQKFCLEIQREHFENTLDSLAQQYYEEIAKFAGNKDSTLFVSLLKSELESCIRDLKFEKQINQSKVQLVCSYQNFLYLQNSPIKIISEGRENTTFVAVIPLQIEAPAEIETKSKIGKLTCYDSNKTIINEYPIYATLDIINSFKKKDEQFNLYVQLEPLWNTLASNPFELLKESLTKTKSIDSLCLFIDFGNTQQYFKELINKTDEFVK